ncbi:putative Ig domain-containing protein [Burkholderia ubonensis]|uniref:putative Ig domain-containing protein n=1 Tax=Burkholderia ubonensis TaxID=101571 RepID=UPI00075B97D3|nr:putative Ig domain-containing protein [Burkholderia ubonensis]KVP75096.1 hypothetical protein WJ93_06685 [Burkholderia ubonensis]
MNQSILRKSLLALLVAASLPACAASFYVVVPVPAKKVSNNSISVSLSAFAAPAGQVGFAYSGFDLRAALSVTGDPGYTGYGVKWQVLEGSLPAGLTLNNNGTVTGTPTVAGTSSFTVRASYKTKTGDQQYQIVTYRIDVGLAAGTPPEALVGQAYAYSLSTLLTVKGDQAFTGAGVTWTVVSSDLPAGLYLTSDGYIGGTPTAAGTGSMTARATYKGVNGEQTYQVVSLSISVALGQATPAQALVGQAYSYDLSALLSVRGDPGFNGTGVTWTVVSSSLPAGLSLSSDGHISGTPTAGGTGSITARAAYKNAQGEQTYQVVALNITVKLNPGTPPEALVGQAYSYNLNSLLQVGGDPGYNGSGVTWNVVSSSLPAGLYLTSDGYIGGTPTAGGTGSMTARATYRNGKGEQTYQVVSLDIKVTLNGATLPVGVTGDSYPGFDFKNVLSVTGDATYTPGAASWSVVSGSLPNGLTLSSNGVVSGTPSTAAIANFTLKAAYKNKSSQYAYALQVDAAQVPGALSADSGTDFGVIGLGGATTRTFTFVNNGNTTATGVYASVSGAGFALWASTCGSPGAPVSLAKGASCNFTARYAPSTAGQASGTVAVNWSGPSASGKSLTVTGAATVDYSWLMSGWTSDAVAIGRNAAWASGMQWFWYHGSAEVSAAPVQAEFRRTIYVGGTSPVNVYLYGATDNQLNAVYVNGGLALGAQGMGFDAWRNSGSFVLQPGTNVISVLVENVGASANPAGFALQVRRYDGALLANEYGWKFHP